MFLPVIRADLLYIGNVHYEESSNADIDKDEDTSHIEPDSEKNVFILSSYINQFMLRYCYCYVVSMWSTWNNILILCNILAMCFL